MYVRMHICEALNGQHCVFVCSSNMDDAIFISMMKPCNFTFSYLIKSLWCVMPFSNREWGWGGRGGEGMGDRGRERERERERVEGEKSFLTLALLASSSFLTYSLTYRKEIHKCTLSNKPGLQNTSIPNFPTQVQYVQLQQGSNSLAQ